MALRVYKRGLIASSHFKVIPTTSIQEWCNSTTLLVLLPFVVRNGKRKLTRQLDKTATMKMKTSMCNIIVFLFFSWCQHITISCLKTDIVFNSFACTCRNAAAGRMWFVLNNLLIQ